MKELLFLVGATASGKTATALEIARRMPVEVVSLDSMNVYRGMDIGTAKPTAADREAVPHHLVDVVDPDAPFSVGDYVRAAEEALVGIRSRGKRPLFAGGTPLYLKAMTAGLFSGPPADRAYRRGLHERAEREGVEALHAELTRVDPSAAARIHPNDLKRIVRGLEVHYRTGRPISEFQTQWSSPSVVRPSRVAGIAWDRQALYRRIELRVDGMFAGGLVEEVRGLLARYGRLGRGASQALGYREVLAHLAGKTDLEETIALVKRNTRRMAKRQMTWFRSFGDIRWWQADETTSPARLGTSIAAWYEQRD